MGEICRCSVRARGGYACSYQCKTRVWEQKTGFGSVQLWSGISDRGNRRQENDWECAQLYTGQRKTGELGFRPVRMCTCALGFILVQSPGHALLRGVCKKVAIPAYLPEKPQGIGLLMWAKTLGGFFFPGKCLWSCFLKCETGTHGDVAVFTAPFDFPSHSGAVRLHAGTAENSKVAGRAVGSPPPAAPVLTMESGRGEGGRCSPSCDCCCLTLCRHLRV